MTLLVRVLGEEHPVGREIALPGVQPPVPGTNQLGVGLAGSESPGNELVFLLLVHESPF